MACQNRWFYRRLKKYFSYQWDQRTGQRFQVPMGSSISLTNTSENGDY